MSKQQQHLWNNVRVRRDGEGEWEWFVDPHWQRLTRVVDTPLHAGVAAELDRLYPAPRTVTLDNGDVWEWTGDGWETVDAQVNDWASRGSVTCAMLDTLYRYQNQ